MVLHLGVTGDDPERTVGERTTKKKGDGVVGVAGTGNPNQSGTADSDPRIEMERAQTRTRELEVGVGNVVPGLGG